MLPAGARGDLIRRLRKIEGQTQGIQRMLNEGRDCGEVINQLASVRAATRRVSVELMKHHLASCLSDGQLGDSEQAIDDVLRLIVRL